MPTLDKSFFGGTGNLDPRTAIKAEIVNTGDSLDDALVCQGARIVCALPLASYPQAHVTPLRLF
jgi:hypothetical protein